MDVKFHSGFSKFLFGEKTTSLSWNGRLEIISEERFRELKAVNERESYKQPGNMPWRVDVDGLFSTYKRYHNSSGNILESEEFTNESDSANPPYEMKDIKCLYVSTYQNDNFLFREDQCSFNIHEKFAEIDLAFSS
ncbi:hypothetical protein [Alkalihalobacterium chitinilyticum]|uniref:Uncharacterized protein n=1 Tax=Alkalihalobacterium chitinilyticum TaxID=2980103 RepID=A0ABT5VEU2_9BACI|nr:hypothetical protein [Alkalihalobacterium chitinilyticum]MDE5413976.1 hypothetical protein [Alkalihalobacterium chitinilyticum]